MGLMQDVRDFMEMDRDGKRAKISEAIDDRVRIITAGLSLKELRALGRGDAPTERPNPRYRVHVVSFLAHIRPKFYSKASTYFNHTFRLGYFSALMFFIEIITGLILMIYYVPSPAQAYGSILDIQSNVMFGQLMRDMHRFGAELMVVFVWLHLFRTYFTGSYKGERSFTWLTGVFLLLVTIFLSFSGYLLPWDQLAYWAVTIGTSMADKAPLFGYESNLIIRGSPDIGAGALLRFYLAHVILLPLAGILILSIHYDKVAREHSISLPAIYEEGNLPKDVVKDAKSRVDLIPDLLTHEVFLASLTTIALIIYTAYFYNAPLETHANPLQTPLDTKAPWYFWWIQGMLKLGDPTTMGVTIPTIMVLILMGIPYIDRTPHRMARNRPWAIGWGLFWVVGLIILSYMGLPVFGIETPPAVRIVQDLAPEEGIGPLREVPFDQLEPGVYYTGEAEIDDMPEELGHLFEEFSNRIEDAAIVAEEKAGAEGEASSFNDPSGLMVISEWQPDLMKVILRIEWVNDNSQSKEFEHEFFLHRDRRRGE